MSRKGCDIRLRPGVLKRVNERVKSSHGNVGSERFTGVQVSVLNNHRQRLNVLHSSRFVNNQRHYVTEFMSHVQGLRNDVRLPASMRLSVERQVLRLSYGTFSFRMNGYAVT